MLVVHHLNNSRSQRVLWLLEELGLEYEIRHHERDPATMLAPPELRAIHPLGKSPVVVDGYNVTKTGYPQMPLEKQRLRLLGQLSQLAAQTGAEVTCVFDGAELAAPVLLAPPRGVRGSW